MVSWLQKIPSGNESHAEGENDEMTDCSKLSLSRLNYVIPEDGQITEHY